MAKVEAGMQFGFLKVLRLEAPRHAVVLCECGTIKTVQRAQLASAPRPIKSCGCKRIELLRQVQLRHGASVKGDARYRTFVTWQAMIWRCTNEKRRDYQAYGGRGITVCERWKSFENFIADMGEKPGSYSIGRINNDGNYEPGNVRWELPQEQARNRRSNRLMTFDGQTKPMVAWAQERGIPIARLKKRMQNGWSVERALTTP